MTPTLRVKRSGVSAGGQPNPCSVRNTAYDASCEIANFQVEKRNTRVALRGNPRGVSSHHVFQRAFGDAYMRRENVRHATLLFRTESGEPSLIGARESRGQNVWVWQKGNGLYA